MLLSVCGRGRVLGLSWKGSKGPGGLYPRSEKENWSTFFGVSVRSIFKDTSSSHFSCFQRLKRGCLESEKGNMDMVKGCGSQRGGKKKCEQQELTDVCVPHWLNKRKIVIKMTD